jgi:hypothetical protein
VSKGVEAELPSGRVVTLCDHPPSARSLLLDGRITGEEFTAYAQVSAGVPLDPSVEVDVRAAVELERTLVIAALQKPKVLEEWQEGDEIPKDTIPFAHLADLDITFILQYAGGGIAKAALFRDVAGGDEPRGDGGSMGQASERDPGDGAGEHGSVPTRPRSGGKKVKRRAA